MKESYKRPQVAIYFLALEGSVLDASTEGLPVVPVDSGLSPFSDDILF